MELYRTIQYSTPNYYPTRDTRLRLTHPVHRDELDMLYVTHSTRDDHRDMLNNGTGQATLSKLNTLKAKVGKWPQLEIPTHDNWSNTLTLTPLQPRRECSLSLSFHNEGAQKQTSPLVPAPVSRTKKPIPSLASTQQESPRTPNMVTFHEEIEHFIAPPREYS